MKSMYLHLEDGAVFSGTAVTEPNTTVGLVSFYSGVVGYQEAITDPANRGKLLLFTYPLIGNSGINAEDLESDSPTVAAVMVKENPPYYSNFRASMSLQQFLQKGNIPLVQGFDTRAILLHIRENGEMRGVLSPELLSPSEIKELVNRNDEDIFVSRNKPVGVSNPTFHAGVIDLGASRSFYQMLSDAGIKATVLSDAAPEKMDLIIVSDAPHFAVTNDLVLQNVGKLLGKAPLLGISHGAAVLAKICGGEVRLMGFGHHGMNVPVRSELTGRCEITVQNHNYIPEESSNLEITFRNINDSSPEGFVCRQKRAAGILFKPDKKYLEEVLRSLEVAI